MKTLRIVLTLLLTIGSISFVYSQNHYTLNPDADFGPNLDGSIRPGDPLTDAGFNQRGLAYDPVSGNLVYVNTGSGSGGSSTILGGIHILRGTNGAAITNLNTNGMTGGSYVAAPTGVADDGVIYVANQVTVSTNAAFKIYRWDGVNSIDPPVVAFSGTLAPSQRYGTSMDVRGSGTSTEILIGSMIGTTATNVVLFTTVDGTNFTANVIGCTNLLVSGTTTNNIGQNFNDGIVFGPSNTFWAKSVSRPLLYLSYDVGAKTARVLNTFFTSNMVGVANLGPLAIDPTRGLLAGIELRNGTVAGGADRVFLYDVSDNSKSPALLSIRDYSPNNQNALAPLGYLDFGGSRLYANVVNNGILASTIDSVTTPAPTILTDLPGTNRVAIGQTARWQIFALPNVTGYRWQVNNVDIPNATNYILDVPNVSLSDSGKVYSVIVSNAGGTTTSSSSLLSVVNPADLFHLSPLWSFGPGGTNYISNSGNANVPNERTIAYNSLSNQLIVVRRNGNTVSNYIIDAHSGQFLYTLRTNGISPGGGGINIPLCGIAVAADGAIYACNVSDNTVNPPNFKIYRWANSDPNTYPSNIFNGNPAVGSTTAAFRWGDVMDVRGSGAGTQIIVDNQEATFRLAGVITPSDPDLNLPWNSKGFVLQNVAGGATIGRSVQFDEISGFFWQKRFLAGGAPLVKSSFSLGDADPALAGIISSSSGLPLYTNGATAIHFGLGLAAAINFSGVAGFSPDELTLYDLANVETPVFLNRYNFPANQNANNNRIAQVLFASNSVLATNYVFALNANNGIVAFTLSSGPVPPPEILAQPRNLRIMQGVGGSISVVLDSIAAAQWQKDSGGNVFTNVPNATNTTYQIANAQLSDSGVYRMFAANSAGAVTSEVATVTVSLPGNNYSLAQVWATPAGSQPYVTSSGGANTPLERSIAYNALSNQLIVVQCPVNSTVYAVYVVDADTGANLYTLNTSGIIHVGLSEVAGANPIDMVAAGVSDDGSLYISSESPNASGGINLPDASKQMRIYRWVNTDSNTAPIEIFAGDPASQTNQNLRWGDVMSVRGGGTNTQLLLDDTTLGDYAAVLQPTDATLTSFTNFPLSAPLGSGPIGHSIQFGAGTTNFWQKRKGLALKYASFNVNSQTATVITNYNFTTTLGGVAVDESRDIAVGVDHVGNANTPDAVALYEISDASTPMLIARYNFPANQNGNANFISQTLIAGNKVFSLDSNNGILALTLVPRLRIEASNPALVLSWENLAGYTLQATPSLSATAVWTNVGAGTLTGGRYYQTNSVGGGALFYRLRATLGQ